MLMTNEPTPAFWVRDVPVHGRIMLAPMAGYADVPFRALCREMGSALSYTEFVAVEELVGKKQTGKAWQKLAFDPQGDRPMVFQIFGNDPDKILFAAQRIEALGPDIIDINMGCSTRKVSGRGAGVGMMKRPDVIARTFELLTHHLKVPVTGKIRLGWDEDRNYMEIGHILQESGASLVAIHPRTKQQGYRGEADWAAIGELKAALSIPVLGNGDVQTPADAARMLAETGCDGVMVGRGAIGNPWIFSGRDVAEVGTAEIFALARRHAGLMVDYYGERSIAWFRKYIKRYLERWPLPRAGQRRLMQAATFAGLMALLDEIEAAVESGDWSGLMVSAEPEIKRREDWLAVRLRK